MKKEICKLCKGTGKSGPINFECLKCLGNGYIYTYEQVFARPAYNKPHGARARDRNFNQAT